MVVCDVERAEASKLRNCKAKPWWAAVTASRVVDWIAGGEDKNTEANDKG